MAKKKNIKIQKRIPRLTISAGRFDTEEIKAIDSYCNDEKVSRSLLIRSLFRSVIPEIKPN